MGNITQVNDAAVKTIFYNNALVVAVSDYTYDSLYRLVTASGRELDDIANFGSSDNWDNSPFIGSYTSLGSVALHNYAQTYVYDTIGIITSLQHAAGAASYTRTNVYSIANNRLSTSQIGSGTPYSYNYHNEHGFLISMPHLTAMKWNFKEELAATSKQAGVNPETTYYQYDSSGKRLRKITENASAAQPPVVKEQRIYIAGYEYYEKFGTGSYVTKTLSLIDNGQRFLMVERSTKSGITSPLTRYIHPNHQGSSNLETDDSGNVITYEEYHPFGTTAYQLKNPSINAMAKRYRYTGMERDDETGLSYHNARYYIPWLGRWLNPDPIGIEDGPNVYAYCRNNPIKNTDKEGTQVDEHIIQDGESQDPTTQKNTGWPKFPEASSPYQKIVPDGKVDSTIYINTTGANFAPEEFQKDGGLETFEKELRRQLDLNGFDFIKIKLVTSTDNLKISPTDQIVNLFHDQMTSNERGETPYFITEPYTSSYTSKVNIAAFTLPAVYNGFPSVANYKVISSPREFANTTAHEVFHGFMTRATAFYGVNEQKLGATDVQGHFDATKNILNSGDQGARNGTLTLDDKVNKNKTLAVEKLPGVATSIIKSWMNKRNVFISPPYAAFKRVIN